MSAKASAPTRRRRAPSPMARWRCWLFNWIARWDETALARSLGLPEDRVIVVDLSADD